MYKNSTGKWWGSKAVQPILALHGRQDNAGTFDALIPLLPKYCSFLCLDLPGHGFSSHYPTGQFYFVHLEGVILLRRIIKYYKWNKVSLRFFTESLNTHTYTLHSACRIFTLLIFHNLHSFKCSELLAQFLHVFCDKFLKIGQNRFLFFLLFTLDKTSWSLIGRSNIIFVCSFLS